MVKKHLYIFINLFFFLLVNLTRAQELPPVTSFISEVYKAQNQNWDISQAEDKTIYVANNSGLLSYDGALWNLYKSPNETILRSVKVIHDKIYTGAYMEFGFWQKNKQKELVYTSISSKIKDRLIEDEQFWNVLQFEGKIIFQSLNRIYIYDPKDEKFVFIDSKSSISKVYQTKKGLYFQKSNEGLFKVEKGKEKLVSNDDVLKNNKIVSLFEDKQENLLVLTQNKGFFELKNDKITIWKTSLNTDFSNIGVYSAIKLSDNSFVLGTISNGMVYLNSRGEFQYQINQSNGLNNNTVLSVFEDSDNDIWLGLDNGIDLLNQQSPFKVYSDFSGELGSIYTSIIFQNHLYLGTNQGLFVKKTNTKENFKFIKETKGQVWSLRNINNTLFCGHNAGTFVIENQKATKISNIEGTWDFKKINENQILQGNYDGLYVLEKQQNKWKIKNKVNNYNISSKFFEILDDNQVFVNHEYKGVLKLNINDDFSKVLKIEKDTISKGLHSGLVKYLDNIYYAYKDGVFKYSNKSSQFKKDTLLSKVFDDGYVSGKLIVNEKENEMWAFSNSSLIKISPSKLSRALQVNKIPLASSVRNSVEGYENILQLNSTNYLFGSSSGYIQIDVSKFPIRDFNVNLNRITAIKNDYINIDEKGVFDKKNNNLTFTFSVAEFDKYLQPNYQYKLKEIQPNWNEWSTKSTKTFENLPHGNYEFLLRAKVGNKISSNVVSYNFKIKRPWYLSNIMLVVYLLGLLLFSLFMHTMYRRYYHKKQEKIIEENEKQKRLVQAENEKEIIKIKNEKLREDFKSKSKELASSIMSIVKKNELLTNVKNEISKVDNKELKPVINLIDKSLKNNTDWEFFQEAFNNADSEFLKRLKSRHPKLTPNDLKLCAYLRLNLSSKEIAPLFNISPRSVEIKRYRLRKKMNLLHEQNLSDYILSL